MRKLQLLSPNDADRLDQELATRMDAIDPSQYGGGIWLDTQLVQYYEEMQRLVTAELEYAKFFRKTSKLLPGTKTFKIRAYEGTGQAEWIASYGDDIPMVKIRTLEMEGHVEEFALGYEFYDSDIETARTASLLNPNVPTLALDTTLGEEAVRGHEEFVERQVLLGSPERKIWGIFSHPNISRLVLADGIDSGTAAVDIAYLVIDAINTQATTTNWRNTPKRLLVPPAKLNYMRSRYLNTANGSNINILQAILAGQSYVTDIQPCRNCIGRGTGGVDVMFLYDPDSDNLAYETPIFFRQKSPQVNNFHVKVPAKSSTTGVIVKRPLECTLIEIPAA